MQRFSRFRISAIFTLVLTLVGAPQGNSQDGLELFEKSVRPVFVERCLECHGPDDQQGGLQLDSRAGWSRGGDSGPAIVPGNVDGSLLIKAIRYKDTALEMPPDGRLPEHVVAAIEKWVEMGAPDPREGELAEREGGVSVEEGREFWSFQPIQSPPVPAVRKTDWPANEIDHFILAELESHGLEPNPEERPDNLIRRVYFDLTGLPPTPQQLLEYVADPSLAKYTETIDRLLESPEFGERFGRRWLDVARFAESSGGGRSLLFPNAWRYRDYVIDAFNADRPYDEFILEQLAGDLLESSSWEEERRRMVATAYLLLGPTNYELQDKDVLEMDIVDEQLDTLGKSLLGMTIGCARCHDHKFDPIPTHDYYAMAGILKSTKSVVHDNVSSWSRSDLPLPPREEADYDARAKSLTKLKKNLQAAKKRLKQSSAELSSQEKKELTATIKATEAEVKRVQARHVRPIAMATTDRPETGDIHVAIRGVVANKGPLVSRGVLRAVGVEHPEIEEGASGRLELAEWIVDRDNPLTSRVMANRVWDWLIGQGIVRTVNNFGSMGERPSHGDLLDHLATQFVERGWSTKRLVRQIMMSRVYRMSAASHAAGEAADPDNRLLWRMNARRLEAEELRDTLLFIADELDRRRGGPDIEPGTKSEYGYEFGGSTRRSVYLPVFRNNLPEIFEVFDFADPNTAAGSRGDSTIAPQALLLMNNPFVIERSRVAAQRLLDGDLEDAARIRHVYLSVLGRQPTAGQVAAARQFLESGGSSTERWAMLYQTLFQSLDFRYLN